ncbi:unnamed protein product [Cuscuta campestris]|uniref:Transcription factor n=1 Tax=Cuscuta campestris TaxID=132261 RepID=A0A484KVJ0_9ASTE|nr:unnamed protein product [Cuscuta campestris]
MGRAPCCDKANVKKGPWAPEEDAKLKAFIEKFGTGGNWIALPQKAGLKRCGKSCRLRWLNYLRPNIKHGDFTDEEDRIICTLYATIGSRWSIIAGQLPGRTDNDIKNYWNTKLKKKLMGMMIFPSPPPYSKRKLSSTTFFSATNNNNNNAPPTQTTLVPFLQPPLPPQPSLFSFYPQIPPTLEPLPPIHNNPSFPFHDDDDDNNNNDVGICLGGPPLSCNFNDAPNPGFSINSVFAGATTEASGGSSSSSSTAAAADIIKRESGDLLAGCFLQGDNDIVVPSGVFEDQHKLFFNDYGRHLSSASSDEEPPHGCFRDGGLFPLMTSDNSGGSAAACGGYYNDGRHEIVINNSDENNEGFYVFNVDDDKGMYYYN